MLKYVSLHIVMPLVIGASLYLIFRPNSLPVFDALTGTRFHESIMSWRSLFHFELPTIILFNLPDALWLYSFLASIYMLIGIDDKTIDFKWIYLPLILALLWELAQLIFPSFGTFDVIDIAFYLFTTIIFIALHPLNKTFTRENSF